MPLKLAIVGRPNVGKSTLFNRLAGRKLAIVDDRPGVTRDRREATGRLGDLDLDLIDTAGFEDVDDESLEARMRRQTERAVEDADVVLFVLDAREGVVPLDRIFADLVRRSGKATVLAANKAEGRQGEHGIAESYQLGLGDPVAISAEHGEGMSELYEALIFASGDAMFEEEPPEPKDNPVKIAIVGRPNAGKSTLVNRLIGEDRLLVGPEAGITRDAISLDWEWEDKRVRLVDTAGLRRKARINETLEKLSTGDTIRAITFAEVVILVMDAENAFETQDLQIADLCEREGRALVFCIAKWDLVADPQARLTELREIAERMLPQVRGTPLIALSAETGRGVDKLMPAVFGVHANWATKIKTRDLNDWLAMAVQRHPPPAVHGRRIKPKYMAQTKARPPTFVLFASRADALPEQYRRYLINSLRESFDFPGVPIRISIRANKNPYADEADGNRSVAEKKWPTKSVRAKPVVKDEAGAASAPATEPAPKLKAKAKPRPGKATPSFKVSAPGKKTTPKKPKTGWSRPVPKSPTTHKLRKPKGPGVKKGPPKGTTTRPKR